MYRGFAASPRRADHFNTLAEITDLLGVDALLDRPTSAQLSSFPTRPRRRSVDCSFATGDPLLLWKKPTMGRPRACAPYRARTKGKDERGVGYMKRNAVAGRSFESFAALEAHLEGWVREVADVRIHGTTGEAPAERFTREEATALRSIAGLATSRVSTS
jgi:hypothetical protein